MGIKFRPYQWEAIEALWQFLLNEETGNPLVCSPTGTGKSIIIAGFIRWALEHYPHLRIMVVTHVKELIEQDHEKLELVWPTCGAGIYSAGLNRFDTMNNVIFAGIASIYDRPEEFGCVNLILVDEAHLVGEQDELMYRKFIIGLQLRNPAIRVVGFTATPWRMGEGMLTDHGGIFTHIAYDITQKEAFTHLIEDGYLTPIIPKRGQIVTAEDSAHSLYDKKLKDLDDQESVTGAILEDIVKNAHGRQRWLLFGRSVDHVVTITEMLNEMGVSARAVHTNSKNHKMTTRQRDENIRAFKAGEFTALVNRSMLTTGFDCAEIDLLGIMCRLTSAGLWVQVLGRLIRPVYAPGYDLDTREGRLAAIANGGKPNGLVLDYGDNCGRLGPINDPRIPKKKGESKGAQEAPQKVCEAITVDGEMCNMWVPASTRECPYCGSEFEIKNNLAFEAGDLEVIAQEAPIMQDYKVTQIVYEHHCKPGRQPCLKVSYYSKFKRFVEYIAMESPRARSRVARWWEDRSTVPLPETVEAALYMTDSFRTVTDIKVWTNKKYPEIVAYCYDGTNFGQDQPMQLDVKLTTRKKLA